VPANLQTKSRVTKNILATLSQSARVIIKNLDLTAFASGSRQRHFTITKNGIKKYCSIFKKIIDKFQIVE